MKVLSGKVALVTGAGRGIGKYIALAYAEAGSDLIICARFSNQIAQVKSAIESTSQQCMAATLDALDITAIAEFCIQIINQYKAVDILVNNAGIYPI